MRVRSTVFVAAAVALSGLVTGCGGDEPEVPAAASSPASPAATSPVAAAGATTATIAPTSPASAVAPTTPIKRPAGMPERKITSVMAQIKANPELQTFATALKVAGLSRKLSKQGASYTVFAPTNDAFAQLGKPFATLLDPSNQRELADLMNFQIVPGRLKTTELKDGRLLTTLQGDRVRVVVNGAVVGLKNRSGTATITVPNALATNGVVQMTDTVLQPRS